MITVRTPNKNYTGLRHGIQFRNGVAQVAEMSAHLRHFFTQAGYGIDGPAAEAPVTSKPVEATPSEPVAAERAGRKRPVAR